MTFQPEFRRQLSTIRQILDGSVPISPELHRVLAERYAEATRRINRRLHGYYDNIELPPSVTLLSAAEYDFWVELCLEYHWPCPEHVNARILAGYLSTGTVPTETAATQRIALPPPERPPWLAPVKRVPPAPEVRIVREPAAAPARPQPRHTARRRKRQSKSTPQPIGKPGVKPARPGWIAWLLLLATLLLLLFAVRYVLRLILPNQPPGTAQRNLP